MRTTILIQQRASTPIRMSQGMSRRGGVFEEPQIRVVPMPMPKRSGLLRRLSLIVMGLIFVVTGFVGVKMMTRPDVETAQHPEVNVQTPSSLYGAHAVVLYSKGGGSYLSN